ncbi:MAG: hypothetical protein CM15mP49_36050 [Actinomycetota bacterium]|nr:MAG: hypothetical protein CM15mP49_36050 [Actinomycetota bacterium]
MAYQSLYRRYRSKTFQELVGQDHIVTALKNAVTENRADTHISSAVLVAQGKLVPHVF